MNLKKYATFLYWGGAIFLLIHPPVKYCLGRFCTPQGHQFLWETIYEVDITKLILYEIALFIGFAFIWKMIPGDDLSNSNQGIEFNRDMLEMISPALKTCSEITAFYRLQGMDQSEAEANAINALVNCSPMVKEHFRAAVRHVYRLSENDLNILANEFLKKQNLNS
jgi:hypothetical protein